jgi:serine/threonine-protein kinase
MQLPSPVLHSGEPLASGSAETLSAEAQHDPRLAFLPAHLEPLRVLGQGGSSIVYEALHTRLKVKVALKLLTMDGPYAEQAQKRMLREAELYALLDDPRIPRVYDVNELPDGTPYVVMEMVPGESLEELLAKCGALSSEHALRITREVLLALASVHERGVLHRDVKPANVILTLSAEGPSEVRLVDFGIAKMSTRGAGEEAVTQRGALIGTPHYMAPERLAGHPADASTDVYAVGIMLYEMLAGTVPFTGPSLPAIMAAVMREVPQTLEERAVAVTPELSRLVAKAMAREPSDRFASARDMLAAVEALTPAPAEVWSEIAPAPRRRRRQGRFWFLAALLSTLLICAGFLLAGTRIELRAEGEPSAAGSAPKARAAAGLPAEVLPAASAPLAPPAPLRLQTGAPKDQVRDEPTPKEPRHHRSHVEVRESAREQNTEREPATRPSRADDVDDSLPDNPY